MDASWHPLSVRRGSDQSSSDPYLAILAPSLFNLAASPDVLLPSPSATAVVWIAVNVARALAISLRITAPDSFETMNLAGEVLASYSLNESRV